MATLITGATGFIGRHVLALLVERGEAVIAFGRQAPKAVQGAGSVTWCPGDLATGEGLQDLPWCRIETVIHLAAAGVKASSRVWSQALAVNVIGTQRLLYSIGNSGHAPTLFIARTFYEKLVTEAPALLENPYIATKAAATELARLFASSYSGRVIFGTFFQVYGPGDDSGNVLSYAAREFKSGRQATFGSGRGLRDWIYITDAARAVVVSTCTINKQGLEVDIGTGALRSIREMVEQLHTLCPQAHAPIFDASKDRPDVNLAAKAQSPVADWQPLASSQFGLTQLLNSI